MELNKKVRFESFQLILNTNVFTELAGKLQGLKVLPKRFEKMSFGKKPWE